MQAAQRSRAPGGAPPTGGGVWRTTARLYQDRGIKGFYQGLRPSLVMVVNPTIQVGAMTAARMGSYALARLRGRPGGTRHIAEECRRMLASGRPFRFAEPCCQPH